MRQSRVRNLRNRGAKSELKTLAKKVMEAVTAGNVAQAEAGLKIAAKRFDQAASKNLIHANAASRKKSRLQHAIKKAKTK